MKNLDIYIPQRTYTMDCLVVKCCHRNVYIMMVLGAEYTPPVLNV